MCFGSLNSASAVLKNWVPGTKKKKSRGEVPSRRRYNYCTTHIPNYPLKGVQRPNRRDVKSVVAKTRTRVAGSTDVPPLPPSYERLLTTLLCECVLSQHCIPLYTLSVFRCYIIDFIKFLYLEFNNNKNYFTQNV
ncbi:hypothetical protein YC2023_046828 [Brassica napus]